MKQEGSESFPFFCAKLSLCNFPFFRCYTHMKTKLIADATLNAQAIEQTLPDGNYLTSPKWGYSEREVQIKGGKVSLVNDGEYVFSQYGFFVVNDVIHKL